jgi:invasion protein IalB
VLDLAGINSLFLPADIPLANLFSLFIDNKQIHPPRFANCGNEKQARQVDTDGFTTAAVFALRLISSYHSDFGVRVSP